MEKKEPAQQKVGAEPEDRAREFEDPKLEFVEPSLTDHGDLSRMTHGFFGTFVP